MLVDVCVKVVWKRERIIIIVTESCCVLCEKNNNIVWMLWGKGINLELCECAFWVMNNKYFCLYYESNNSSREINLKV